MQPFSIQSLISRSHAPLTSLSIKGQGDAMSEDDLIECIFQLPDLVSLQLWSTPITDASIIALSVSPRSSQFDRQSVLLPVLNHLTLGAAKLTASPVIDMIRSRWEYTSHPLISVHLHYCKLSLSDNTILRSFRASDIAKKMGLVWEMKNTQLRP
ncbi:hypothetical protein BD410DRAFT_516378 [Rickenella mellea]|uniref:F-box domain-containing protein n=1 Tax=Rickenella mellea TaxID=50990 RepID=A0A4Y7PTU8_9AGAM|nr:hypothetical protein BD410DRAFT_516378 [Rickenella mellea]